jgi:hypothetical protein
MFPILKRTCVNFYDILDPLLVFMTNREIDETNKYDHYFQEMEKYSHKLSSACNQIEYLLDYLESLKQDVINAFQDRMIFGRQGFHYDFERIRCRDPYVRAFMQLISNLVEQCNDERHHIPTIYKMGKLAVNGLSDKLQKGEKRKDLDYEIEFFFKEVDDYFFKYKHYT